MFAADQGSSPSSTTYVDDVFSTYLRTGTGATATVNNGIDLSTKGGMIWCKGRSAAHSHWLVDTTRGATNYLVSSSTNAQNGFGAVSDAFTSFGTTGYSLGAAVALGAVNTAGVTYVDWTFRRAPKFFDVVTYSGDSSLKTISHSLGVTPGMIIIKPINTTGDWITHHTSLGYSNSILLNSTAASVASSGIYASSATTFSVSNTGGYTAGTPPTGVSTPNLSGVDYVAYLFAHDASADGLIQCGSYTADGSGNATVNLGWEPQFLLIKRTDLTGGWVMRDSMRGILGHTNDASPFLEPNTTTAEQTNIRQIVTPTGFNVSSQISQTHIYLAIRRPNKPPTTGTQVYNAITRTGTGVAATVTGMGFAPDTLLTNLRTAAQRPVYDRLRGIRVMTMNNLGGDGNDAGVAVAGLDTMDGFRVGADTNTGYANTNGASYVYHAFKRAVGVYDVVPDVGTGAAHTITHGLGAIPELIIRRSTGAPALDWQVYSAALANTEKLALNLADGRVTDTTAWNSTTPTASVFTVGTGAAVNTNATNFISYLFASKVGISKCGSYTGNGSSQTINCGFTAGARFVLIKRVTAGTSNDWFVWDTARGIVAGNDPYLSLNMTEAEVTTDDSIDPDTSGFIVNQLAATNINVTSATYIYLAFA